MNDNGIQLRWYDNSRSPFETSLLQIIEKRAAIAGYTASVRELWYEWFPGHINNTDSLQFILVNTRYLPRDFISFFREVQQLGKEPPYNRVDVLSALNNYSDWFLLELTDALVGLVDESVRTALPNIFSDLGREFTVQDLDLKLADYGLPNGDGVSDAIARELFNTSWIGNKWDTGRGTWRFSWRHRKINARLNLGHNLIVHSGLFKTLNLV